MLAILARAADPRALVTLLWLPALVVALIVWSVSAQTAGPPSPPLFSPGQTYTLLWDCAPEYLAQAVSTVMAGGQQLNPCFSEEITVQAVRSDGWVLVTDASNAAWTINPARLIGFKVIPPPVRAGR